jgi:hypothetical protein
VTRDPPALVLLPGLDGTGDLFQPLLSRLDRSIEPVVVRYPLAEPLGYEALTSIARRALPTTGPYVILGESFSGPIAVQLAAERSGELRGADPLRVVRVEPHAALAAVPVATRRWSRVVGRAPPRAAAAARAIPDA